MKAYMKDVLEFAATVFCAIATNAIILFIVYLICGTLESGAVALLFFILVCFVFPFECNRQISRRIKRPPSQRISNEMAVSIFIMV